MKLSHLRNIIRESIKELMLNEIEFLTQQEMDDACAHHGYGSGVSHDCTPDANDNVPPTYNCEIVCENGMVVSSGNDTPLALDKTKHVDRSNTNKPPRPTRRNIR